MKRDVRYDLVVDEEFDRILGNIIDNALLDDPGETAPSAVGTPTRNGQVLANCKKGGDRACSQRLYHDTGT